MSEPQLDHAADQKRLQEIIEKDAKSGRTLSGLWYYITVGLGIFMVAFYMYCAATPVDTQYFIGTYVLITYVLVFLLYPFTSRTPRQKGYYIDAVIPFTYIFLSIYFALHFLLGSQGAEESFTQVNVVYALVGLVGALCFFLPIKYIGNTRGGSSSIIAMDVFSALAATFVVGYYIIEYMDINYRMGSENALDTAVSVLGIIISLEVARRLLGWSMALVGLMFLSYALWGDLLHQVPVLNAFAHTGFKLDRALNHIYLKEEGVFGIMATVLVTYVILFIFFGSFLKASGAGRFFLDLPMALAGKSTGGPAKVAVLASGFFGSVSGSAIANTVSTGAFTIPLMKKAGFRPHVAGAIEPAASIGGMFMPPIMGAGGFIMAEMTGIPYVKIMLMAIFPAMIYFLSVFVMVHFEAKRWGLVGYEDPNARTAREILKTEWFMSLPLVIIVVMMLFGYSPGYAAFWAILSCIGVSWLTKDNRMGAKKILQCMIEGSRATLVIGATVGVIGIIVGTIQLTGIGLKFSQIIIELSFGHLPLAILLVGLASLVLGMGVPVTAAYLITAVLAVGALTDMIARSLWGVSLQELRQPLMGMMPNDPHYIAVMAQISWAVLASHMIVYWFSQDSNITPPVCVAAYAGAAIAGADPWKTGWTSFKFAKMLYMGPFLFAFSPGFLLGGPGFIMPWYQVVSTWVTIILGTIAFGSLTMGYFLCGMTILEWGVCALATFLLFFPHAANWLTPGIEIPTLLIDFAGIALWSTVYFMQKVRIKKDPSLTLPIEQRQADKKALASQRV
ncbi:MAG: C4-dicarboxylate ABC transporter permease [Desulfatitalea sp. BRH_c12]|nr:MAG: C4-dicarboxylate ABC transporter permease [Desulfatitalea sp. BRH_c12]